MHQLTIFIAGMLNGFYLLPLTKNADQNNGIWFLFGLIGFCAIPLVLLIVLITLHGFEFSFDGSLAMALAGLIYGLGIVLLTISIRFIGIGVPFVFSIIMGTFNGALFNSILFDKLAMITPVMWVGYAIFVVAALCIAYSLGLREKDSPYKWTFILVCFIASILTSFEGASIGYFSQIVKIHHFPTDERIIPWLFIFIFCSISVMVYYSFKINRSNVTRSNLLRVGVMVLFYALSVLLYSYANQQSGLFSAKYNWVIFMASIMIGGNLLSYLKREWVAAPKICHFFNVLALMLAILSCYLITP